ncbi:hypothetical protein [Sphingomonas sp.]|uniref:hypothetical protein n=1 Tax=Sphingomonas sp. TaxID=28214 RepID=UPI001B06604D|nr:hypothetical protein [Sphingomonas sp.]MBO9713811.1 hypothetical protein [Sphingomonas sp.]
MRFLRPLIGVLLLLAVPLPVLAQQANKGHAAPPDSATLRDYNEQMTAYGQWLVRLNEACAIANDALTGLQAQWRAASAAGAGPKAVAQFRPVLAEAKAKVAAARARLLTLDQPSFDRLDLTPDLLPAELVRQVVKVLDASDSLLDTMATMLAAVEKGDQKAQEQAAYKLFEAAEILLETQAIMADAGLATAEKGTVDYYPVLLQARFFRSGLRAAHAVTLLIHGKPDPDLAVDLRAHADAITEIGVQGRDVIDRETGRWEAAIAGEGSRKIDANAVAILRKAILVLRLERGLFDAADRYAGVLRLGADVVKRNGPRRENLTPLLAAFRALRDEIQRTSQEESRLMAQ